VSAQPLAAEATSMIGKETIEKRISYNEYRMSIDECRIKEFFLFYLLKEQSEATSTIRQSSIFIRHSMKFHVRCPEGESLNPET
jgi:hypothetical protein